MSVFRFTIMAQDVDGVSYLVPRKDEIVQGLPKNRAISHTGDFEGLASRAYFAPIGKFLGFFSNTKTVFRVGMAVASVHSELKKIDGLSITYGHSVALVMLHQNFKYPQALFPHVQTSTPLESYLTTAGPLRTYMLKTLHALYGRNLWDWATEYTRIRAQLFGGVHEIDWDRWRMALTQIRVNNIIAEMLVENDVFADVVDDIWRLLRNKTDREYYLADELGDNMQRDHEWWWRFTANADMISTVFNTLNVNLFYIDENMVSHGPAMWVRRPYTRFPYGQNGSLPSQIQIVLLRLMELQDGDWVAQPLVIPNSRDSVASALVLLKLRNPLVRKFAITEDNVKGQPYAVPFEDDTTVIDMSQQ